MKSENSAVRHTVTHAASSSMSEKRPPSPNFDYVTGLARGLAVIRSFAHQHERLTLAEISRLVDLPRATVRRCLLTLNALGYVEKNGKYFRLTPQILTFSRAYFSSNALPHIGHRFAQEVTATTGASCSISVMSGDEVVYIARSALKRPASAMREIGSSLPAYSTAMGRVLLANMSDDEVDAYFGRVELKRFTSKTVVDKRALRRILKQVRRDNFAFVEDEMEHGLSAIAVPIRNATARVVAAIHLSAEGKLADRERMTAVYLPALLKAAAQMQPLLVG